MKDNICWDKKKYLICILCDINHQPNFFWRHFNKLLTFLPTYNKQYTEKTVEPMLVDNLL